MNLYILHTSRRIDKLHFNHNFRFIQRRAFYFFFLVEAVSAFIPLIKFFITDQIEKMS